MNDSEYLKQMVSLNEALNRAAEAEPFDEEKWKSAVVDLHKVNQLWYYSHHRPRWYGLSYNMILWALVIGIILHLSC